MGMIIFGFCMPGIVLVYQYNEPTCKNVFFLLGSLEISKDVYYGSMDTRKMGNSCVLLGILLFQQDSETERTYLNYGYIFWIFDLDLSKKVDTINIRSYWAGAHRNSPTRIFIHCTEF